MVNFSAILKNKFVKHGLPLILLVVGGSVGLQQFSQIRYQFSKKKSLDVEELKKYGIEKKKPGEVTLETEYEKILKLDIDNWTPVRVRRPWENEDGEEIVEEE